MNYENRAMRTEDREAEHPNDTRPQGHCYDAEKCNAETFCDCPCRACTRMKRGERYEGRG